jgi:hypothetical protein
LASRSANGPPQMPGRPCLRHEVSRGSQVARIASPTGERRYVESRQASLRGAIAWRRNSSRRPAGSSAGARSSSCVTSARERCPSESEPLAASEATTTPAAAVMAQELAARSDHLPGQRTAHATPPPATPGFAELPRAERSPRSDAQRTRRSHCDQRLTRSPRSSVPDLGDCDGAFGRVRHVVVARV